MATNKISGDALDPSINTASPEEHGNRVIYDMNYARGFTDSELKEKLKSDGYNPEDYTITHKDKDVVFTKKESSAESSEKENMENAVMAGMGGISVMEDYWKFATEAGKQQLARSNELWNVYKNEYLPGEIALAKESFAGIPFDQETGRASADVNTAFDKATAQKQRQLQGMGINPASPAYNSMMSEYAAARAAAEAGARNNARRNLRAENYNRRTNAVNMGRGLLPSSTSMASTGTGMYGAGAGGLNSAYNNLMNLYNQQTSRDWTTGENAASRDWQANQQMLNREWQQKLQDDAEKAQFWNSAMQLGGMAAGGYLGGLGGAAGAKLATSGISGGMSSNLSDAYGGYTPSYSSSLTDSWSYNPSSYSFNETPYLDEQSLF